MGELIFKRIVYKSKETGEYVYPIDAVIGLSERDRISNELSVPAEKSERKLFLCVC